MSFYCQKIYELNEQLNPLTGIHEHSIQYITPNGGPKSAYHFEPNSRNVFPNRHSATTKNYQMKLKRQEKLIKFIMERPFFSHKPIQQNVTLQSNGQFHLAILPTIIRHLNVKFLKFENNTTIHYSYHSS